MTNAPTDPPRAAPTPRRRSWQWGLRTTILLVALAAVTIAVVNERRRIAELAPRVDRLRGLARELVVTDPGRMAAVKREATWSDDNRWDVFLPPGSTYRLAIATREVGGKVPAPRREAPIAPGRHRVAFEQEGGDGDWRLAVTVDAQPSLAVVEPLAWKISGNTSGKGDQKTTEQVPPGQPLVLNLDRFLVSMPNGTSVEPQQPGPGIAVWIDRLDTVEKHRPAAAPAP